MMYLLITNTIDPFTGVITCQLLGCFYQLFGLSFWRHPFTAEEPLMMQWYISPNLVTNILADLRVSTISFLGKFFGETFFKVWVISADLAGIEDM